MAQDRLTENILTIVRAKVRKDVSEKLGSLTRDLNNFIKKQKFSQEEEIELGLEFLSMIKEGCEDFQKKMRIRTEKQEIHETLSE